MLGLKVGTAKAIPTALCVPDLLWLNSPLMGGGGGGGGGGGA